MFYDPSYFNFTQALEANWQVFGLFDFPHAKAIASHVQQCPVTASLIEQHIPTHGAAGFSLLQPKTQIKPHQGYQGDFLRCHLGLKIPQGDCALKVNNEIRNWKQGKVIIFDDRVIHNAWNLTQEKRVILLIDFVNHK